MKHSFAFEPTVVAVATFTDLEDSRQVSIDEARDHFAAMGIPYFETSSKTGKGVKEAFDSAIDLWFKAQDPSVFTSVNENQPSVHVPEKKDQCIIC